MGSIRITKEYLLVSTLIVTVFLVIAYLTDLSVWVVDDWIYQFDLSTVDKNEPETYTQRVQGLGDIWNSQICHYMEWNGRFICHFIVQIFCGLLGKLPFSILNGIAYPLFAYMMLNLSGVEKNLFSWSVVLLASMVCFTDLFAVANQVNYIWMGTLVCYFLCVYFKKDDNVPVYMLIILFLFSVIAGSAQETYNVPVGGALLIHHIIKKKEISVKQWVMFVGCGIGGLILCLGPGTLSRSGCRSIQFVVTIYHLFIELRLPYVLIFLLLVKCKSFATIRSFVKENYFWFCVIIFSILFNLFVGITINRQLFAAEIASLILSLKLLEGTMKEKIIVGLIAIFAGWGYFQIASSMQFEKKIYAEIEKLYLKSDTGVVYYDIPYNDKCKWMTPSFYIHSNNPHNEKSIFSFGETLNHEYGLKKKLVILPTVLLNRNVENSVQNIGDGTYLLIQNKNNPVDFYIQREYKFGFITKFKDEVKVDFNSKKLMENETNRVLFFYNATPLVNNTAVIIRK